MNYQIHIDDQENICLSGAINFSNVVAIRAAGMELMNAVSTIYLDLAEVTQVDSSSLALLIAWKRCASLQHKTIKLLNTPIFLASLARVSGLDLVLA